MQSLTLLTLIVSLLTAEAAVIRKQPLTDGDKRAVGEALNKALTAMQGHGGGSKWEACASMYPDGKPPADQNDPTWQACKSEFYQYVAASLLQNPLTDSDKQAVGEALTKALNAMQHHAGGSKWEACISMFPNGQPPADQNDPTWISCKSEFVTYAAASLVQQPISSSDKAAVGEALTKALQAMQGHGGGSKYEACANMYPDGKAPADQNDPTWVACRTQFYAYAAASLLGVSSSKHSGKQESLLRISSRVKQPMTSSDKQAVGEALTKALKALQGHASGSKYEACADMFPDGKPPADQSSATWQACRDQFYAYAAASLVQQPLSSSDKQAVGEALTKALKAMQGHASGSKYGICSDMFPNGQPPADKNDPTWISCKDQFYTRGSLVGEKSVTYKGAPPADLSGAEKIHESPLTAAHRSSAVKAFPAAVFLIAALPCVSL